MPRDLVLGSGPSGVAAAAALIARGREVVMLDAGGTMEPGPAALRARMGSHGAEGMDGRGPGGDRCRAAVRAERRNTSLRFGFCLPHTGARAALGRALGCPRAAALLRQGRAQQWLGRGRPPLSRRGHGRLADPRRRSGAALRRRRADAAGCGPEGRSRGDLPCFCLVRRPPFAAEHPGNSPAQPPFEEARGVAVHGPPFRHGVPGRGGWLPAMRDVPSWLPLSADLQRRPGGRCARRDGRPRISARSARNASSRRMGRASPSTPMARSFRGDRLFVGCGVLPTTVLAARSLGLAGQWLTIKDSAHFFLPMLHGWSAGEPGGGASPQPRAALLGADGSARSIRTSSMPSSTLTMTNSRPTSAGVSVLSRASPSR